MTAPNFTPGSLVRARGRDWVVQAESAGEMLVLRPLGGTEHDLTGVWVGPGRDGTPLETVESAGFPLPNPATDIGNLSSAAILRDAARLGLRTATGPFRSLARLAVTPASYQYVPLLMGLRQRTVRLLIADDVGVGKTIESLLIARELMDRGEIRGFSVLAPAHMTAQWHKTITGFFNLDAVVVQPGKLAALERDLPPDQSVFTANAVTVLSVDYIKQPSRRETFVRDCPELLIVDEAHTCADGTTSGAQRRWELLRDIIARDPKRHLLLVTATPHAGKPETFRSLLQLLNPDFAHLPPDLTGEANRKAREQLAQFYCQRRRADIESDFPGVHPFPTRLASEATYLLTPEYRTFIEQVMELCRTSYAAAPDATPQQRMRWWSALALLRSVSSSPEAAVSTLRNRAGLEPGETEDVDAVERVMDASEDEGSADDLAPTTASGDLRARLAALIPQAELLCAKDAKRDAALRLVQKLLNEGKRPILFCRFIPTVEALATHLRKHIKDCHVATATGLLDPEDRVARVKEAGQHDRRVLVTTDCLAEGIDLQHEFDTVIHYDLAWNPTRHEQREGRVDRYGQPQKTVGAIHLYSPDNPVDGVVLAVILDKHNAIRKQLGVAVPMPADAAQLERAISAALKLRGFAPAKPQQLQLDLGDEADSLHLQWAAAADREKVTRSLLAQHGLQREIKASLEKEIAAAGAAIGTTEDVERFIRAAVPALGGSVTEPAPGLLRLRLTEREPRLTEALGLVKGERLIRLQRDGSKGDFIQRTHPLVEELAQYCLEASLDPTIPHRIARCGGARVREVTAKTTLLLLRLRFRLTNGGDVEDRIAEEILPLAFTGSAAAPVWLDETAVAPLLQPTAVDGLAPAALQNFLNASLADWPTLQPALKTRVDAQREALRAAHTRVRSLAQGRPVQVVHMGEPDLLSLFLLYPPAV